MGSRASNVMAADPVSARANAMAKALASSVRAAASTAMPVQAAFTIPMAGHSAIVAPTGIVTEAGKAASPSSTGRGRRGSSVAPAPTIGPTVVRNAARNGTTVQVHPPRVAPSGCMASTPSPPRSPIPPAACVGWW